MRSPVNVVRLVSALAAVGLAIVYSQDDIPAVLVALVVSVGVFAATFLFRRPAPPALVSAPAGEAIAEWKILRSAEARKGTVTPVEVAADARCSVESAQASLESLHHRGVCRMEVSASGQLVFHFPDFASPDAKQELI